MNETCVVSVAFRQPYLMHSNRQEHFITVQEMNVDKMYFRDMLPAKGIVHTVDIVTEFQKSLYGFKPHAIQRAIDKGYKKVIWLDPSVLPITNLQVLIDALDKHPIIVRSGEEPLSNMCNQKAKNWFGVTDAYIKDEKTVAGTVYCFNFNNPKAIEVFNLWKKAEEEGIFQNQDAFMKGDCWADEAAFALCLYKIKCQRYWENDFKFLNQKELN